MISQNSHAKILAQNVPNIFTSLYSYGIIWIYMSRGDIMFAKRFDALMNIAEVSNSLLGRDINMKPITMVTKENEMPLSNYS